MTSQPELTLFVKAGDDGKKYGACPFCQRLFMILLVKSTHGLVHFQVATVNLAKPPEVFKKLTLRRVPALIHRDTALDNVDEMLQYLDEVFPTPSLCCDNSTADPIYKDVFQKFCFFIKEVSKDSSQLETELKKIDTYLIGCGFDYLVADRITHQDCELLPKIHHIKIASKALKGFEIPKNLVGLWKYLARAYKDDIFVKSCPSDQEIVVHWADKPETPKLSMELRAKMAREEPLYSFSAPIKI